MRCTNNLAGARAPGAVTEETEIKFLDKGYGYAKFQASSGLDLHPYVLYRDPFVIGLVPGQGTS